MSTTGNDIHLGWQIRTAESLRADDVVIGWIAATGEGFVCEEPITLTNVYEGIGRSFIHLCVGETGTTWRQVLRDARFLVEISR